MMIKQTLIEVFIIILCVLGGLYFYHHLIDKQSAAISPVIQKKNDSLQNEINKRDVKIGILNYRDSLLQSDYENKINELKSIQPKYIQTIKSIKKMTPSQIDSKYLQEVIEQNSELGAMK